MAEQSVRRRSDHTVIVVIDDREAFGRFSAQDVFLEKLSEIGLDTEINGQSLLIS